MTTIGYAAMLEQFHPTDLLDWCAQAEDAGFEAGFMVSEHFHPWTPQQGQSAFAWSFMGALGQRTSLRFGTAVTCPGFRYHPAVIAHAAATLGAMYPGRFWLGLGAGEALNEHVIGGVWPEVDRPQRDDVRGDRDHQQAVHRQGRQAQRASTSRSRAAKLYTRPPDDQRVPIYVATSGPVNAKKTGKFADGMITVGAADEKIKMLWGKFEEGCARGRQGPAGPEAPPDPRLLGADRGRGPRERDASSGPTAAWPSRSRTSRTPRTSPAMAKLVRPEDFKNRVLISSDLEEHPDHIQHYVDMGYDEIHLHNVGRNQAEFIEVFGKDVLPNLRLG